MKASYLSLGLLLLASIAAGCDNISEDDRYIKVEKPVIDNPRTLLIMEFTGNTCMNCPTGAGIVEKIKDDEAPGRVISVGLHPYGSHFTDPVASIHTPSHKQDLRSEAATALFDYYQPSGFPAAVFNGLKSSMSGSTGDWQQRASEALKATSYISLSATCDYDEATRGLTVDYDAEFLDDVNRKLNITVWLVENKIMGTQTMQDGKLNVNYEHNHVLRASLNGDWGQELGSSFAEGSKTHGQASMTLKEDWVADNCNVVVYVYRDDNKEVEQAVSVDFSKWMSDHSLGE
ncbi:MAG: Omp28 family outer membrane lipoprotein [Muribaculaceae bacterium]|nr:Omp28 family outer membrane lipoprotein [Muribaculaceae bacterium]